MTPPTRDAISMRDMHRLLDSTLTASNAREVDRAIGDLLKAQIPNNETVYRPTDRQLQQMVNELRKALQLPPESGMHTGEEVFIPGDYLPVPSEASEAPHSHRNAEMKWLPLPAKSETREMLHAMARDAFPSTGAQQTGLSIFFEKGATPTVPLGETANSGAALLIPKAQVQALLQSLAVKMPSPELSNAVHLLQSLLPLLPHLANHPASGAPLKSWFQAHPNLEPAKFFASLAEVFQAGGMGNLPEVHQLMGVLIQDSGVLDGPDGPALSQELQKIIQSMSAANSPLLGGVREFLGGNLMQGLQQMLQPLLRVLTGLFLAKGEAVFPRCTPDEKALAGMATLFAAHAQKRERQKLKKKRKGAKFPAFFGFIDGDPEAEDETFVETRQKIPVPA